MDNRVYYLGHSAWAVETPACYMLFDCQDENVKKGGTLQQGYLDLALLNAKPVYMFYSHSHHDHYSPKLHRESHETGRGCTVLGGFKSPLANTVTLLPHEKKDLGLFTVYTAASTDAGVCFFIKTDGLGIFFAGDHADWGDGDPANKIYYKEMDYIAALNLKTDFAFIPVCTYSGKRPGDMTKGAVYAITALKPAVTFPMHGNGNEYLYGDFYKDFLKTNHDFKIVCASQKGMVDF